jgi:nickel/cobalt exporter
MGTIVAREPSPGRAGWLGAVWGLGHSAALFGASCVILALRVPVSPQVAGFLEFGVAIMLIVLGIQSLRRASGSGSARPRAASPRRPFVIGLVHGLAGSGGLALILLTTIGDPIVAIIYMALFGIGSIGGMAAWSALLALPLAAARRRSPGAARWIPAISGAASVAIGLVIVAQLS